MTLSIAIIEDNPTFRHRFENHIHSAPDMRLLGSAHDFASGEALLCGQPADILLVDLGLPGGNGVDLIAQAQQCWPLCEAMVITVFGDEHNVIAALRAGATGYVLKDATQDALLTDIRLLRDGGSPISPVIARQLLKSFKAEEVQPLESPLAAKQAIQPASRPKLAAADTITLSEQEQQVLVRFAKGYTIKEIAKLMLLSNHTVATYVRRSYRKLQVNSKTEALYEARRLGLVKD